MEFASAGLDGNHWAEGRLVTKLLSQQFIRDWLRLRWGRWWRGKLIKKEDAKKKKKDSLKDMELKKAGVHKICER